MDLQPSLDDLQRGLHHKWRYNLGKARKQGLELVEGAEDQLFEDFEHIHDEMVERKKFVSFTDIGQFRKIQRELPHNQRMRVVLCKDGGEVCAGGICSALGDTGIYLFGATSTRGLTTNGSYLVHWRMLEWVRSLGCSTYDLNGIDPVKNPGGYQFKSRLAGACGREVTFVGQYDVYPGAATRMLFAGADLLRGKIRRGRETLANWS